MGSVELGRLLIAASIWNGAAGSWMMLHNIRPSTDKLSANDIWLDGDAIDVVGSARHWVENRNEMILWTNVPEPGTAGLAGLAARMGVGAGRETSAALHRRRTARASVRAVFVLHRRSPFVPLPHPPCAYPCAPLTGPVRSGSVHRSIPSTR
ncbi:MAG: hypothetical protein AMXMBFR58_04050 [Phycisphaerae bacterium]